MKAGGYAWLGCFALMLANAASAQQGPAVGGTAATPSDADLVAARCAIGEEKFLPADYYYCLAAQSYGQHQYRYALRFFRTAASWASKPAQYVLGVMALNGDQQPVDRPLALAWFTLAAERPGSAYADDYQALLKQTTPEEQRRADALLAQMRPIYGDANAAARAQDRYQSAIAKIKNTDSYCIAGMWRWGDEPSSPQAAASSDSCAPTPTVIAQLDKTADTVFQGWSGHVTVGPLQNVPKP